MSYFAKLDSNNKVLSVIVADQDFINQQQGIWQPADYTGISPKNYPGIGYTWNGTLNGYIPPQLFPSWILDESTCLWNAPVAYPLSGGPYKWDENLLSWIVIS